MNETNHPARRLRHGDRPTEPLTFEDAAANKAAEEGEPTDAELAREVLLEELEGIANYWDCTEVEGVSGNIIDVGKDLREKFAALKFAAIAADRASRQVANKAEVEPVAFMYQDDQDLAEPGTGSCVVSKARCNFYRNETPLYATPPATTAASTVLTDEPGPLNTLMQIAEFLDSSRNQQQTGVDTCDYASQFDYELGHAASEIRSIVADISSQVAAQAGQVAAIGEDEIEWSHDIQERLLKAVRDEGEDEDDRQVMAEAACLLAALTGRAAPSPAKESK